MVEDAKNSDGDTDETIEEMVLSLSSTNLCLSGGAQGADLQWGMNAGKAGHKVIHWSFKGHSTKAPGDEVVKLGPGHLKEADGLLVRANEVLKRQVPFRRYYVMNLLRRNFWQIRWSESVYAVGKFDENKQVSGGTAWATQMYMDRFLHDGEDMEKCKLFFYDQNSDQWFQWTGAWQEVDSPEVPTGIWTGIGSRDLSDSGKEAIRAVFS